MLLYRGFGHDKVGCDVACCGRGDERVVGQRRLAQCGDDIDLAPGQLGHCRPAWLGLRQHVFSRQTADPAPLGPERQHVTVLEQSLGYDLAVDPVPFRDNPRSLT